MAAFGRKPTGLAQRTFDKRRSARIHIGLAAMLETVATRRMVSLRDISTTGAQVDGDLNIKIGNDVLLKVQTIEILAEVKWSEGGSVGIQFERPVSNKEINILRSVGQDLEATEMQVDEPPISPMKALKNKRRPDIP